MSSIGKILIVINAVLSLLFLGFASALVYKSGDFKNKYDQEVSAHNQTRTEKDKQISDTRAALTTLQKENDATRSEKARFATEADSLRNAYDQEKAVNAQLRGAVDEIKSTLDNFRTTNQDLQAQLDGARKDYDQMREARDAAVSAQTKSETEAADAVAAMKKAQTDFENLRDSAETAMKERDSLDAKYKALIAMTGVPGDSLQAQPLIEGHVADVAPDAGLVALNVGKVQGVQPGYSFDIYKDGQYKGKVIVDTVEANYCSARITMQKPGTSIEKGDQATTRL